MTTKARKARFAYAMMVAFMALSTAALAAAASAGGYDTAVHVVKESVTDRTIASEAG